MKKFLILFTIFIFLDCSQTQKIQVPKEIEEFYSSYNKAWSNGDFNFISEEIYAVPFTLYLNDTTLIFFTKNEVKSFLQTTFDDLKANNYGYSIRNNWENYQSKNDMIIISHDKAHQDSGKDSFNSALANGIIPQAKIANPSN